MNYSKQYITELIEKFNGGQTTESEEQILGEYFAIAEDIPSEWEVYKDMFESFASGAYDFSEAEISEYLTARVTLEKSRTSWRWVAAACVTGVAGLLWFLMPSADVEQEVTMAELYETMSILSEAGYGQVEGLQATPNGKGFVIKAVLADGESCSFTMQRTSEGFSVKLL